MYLSIVILPLLGSIVSGFFGRKVGSQGSQIITSLGVILTTIIALILFFEVGFNGISVSINLSRWLDSEFFNIFWDFGFDALTVSMLIPVLIISSLVHIYSIGYMSNDPHNQRFFSYLSLFTFMMIVLVTGNNYLLMFVGWEGVGVCSYLLVNFWFTRIAANQSSISAFLTNRVGDCFLTIGMFAILWSFGNIDYATVFSLAPFINENIIIIIGICLLIGAMAKSSQVGLHVWLPMAMEGPTPVSALIHAATMVTAGVYLLMRSSPLIEYSSTILLICLWLGGITTIFSSLIGLYQQDIKKVIAYSTMSQLGMMVIAIGLSSYNVALFHLVNHAFYKALLFLGAGAVIHSVGDNQDFRKYGGLIAHLPLSYSVMLIASLSLVAIPFMTGFFSKDFILESAYGQYNYSSITIYVIAVIGAIFTTLYSLKVLYLTFLTNPNGPVLSYKHAHESDIYMSLPLILLAIFSIIFGYITKDIFIGLASGFFNDNSIFIHPVHEIMLDTEFAVSLLFKLLPFILTLLFSGLVLLLSEFLFELIVGIKLSRLGYIIFGFLNQRFLIEFFYNKYITILILNLGGQTTSVLDNGSVELIGPYGIERMLTKSSKNIVSLSTGIVTNYALYILISFLIFILSMSILVWFQPEQLLELKSMSALAVTDYYSEVVNGLSLNEFENNNFESCLININFDALFLIIIFCIINIILNIRSANIKEAKESKFLPLKEWYVKLKENLSISKCINILSIIAAVLLFAIFLIIYMPLFLLLKLDSFNEDEDVEDEDSNNEDDEDVEGEDDSNNNNNNKTKMSKPEPTTNKPEPTTNNTGDNGQGQVNPHAGAASGPLPGMPGMPPAPGMYTAPGLSGSSSYNSNERQLNQSMKLARMMQRIRLTDDSEVAQDTSREVIKEVIRNIDNIKSQMDITEDSKKRTFPAEDSSSTADSRNKKGPDFHLK